MTAIRDRLLAAATLVLLALVGVFLVALLREAEDNAVRSREDSRLEHVEQLAKSMDTRVLAAYTGVGAALEPAGSIDMTPRSAATAARLTQLIGRTARTGAYLVDPQRRVVNGALLRDPATIGRTVDLEGLEGALAGQPTITPVGPALTTSSRAIGIVLPVRGQGGAIVGALVYESEVTVDSAFNREVSELRVGTTGRYSFADRNGVAVASSDEQVLGRTLGLSSTLLRPGFHRHGERVDAVADVPSAAWKVVFEQSVDEFEGDLTGPLGRALFTLLIGTGLAGLIAVFALLRRLRAAREEQRRLADIASAREEFTSIVSHELRTPVAGLLGFLETTVDHWDEMDDAARQRAVRRAYANARTLRSLTADVLDTSAIDAGALGVHAERFDLRDAVEESVASAREADPERPFEVDLPADPVPVLADRLRLVQVVSNLLDNAVKSSPAASPVSITLVTERGSCTVRVGDQGSGIAPEDRERIFERFVRGRTSSRGSGLGLYIARTLVEAHGGRIWAGEGADAGAAAAVAFSLPLDQPSRLGGAPAGRPS
jgi:signal transduction histidine kinase